MPIVPTTWPELHVRFQARNEEEPRSLSTTAVERMKKHSGQSPVGRQFGGVEEILSRLAVLRGAEPCRQILEAQAPFYAIAADEAARDGTSGALPIVRLILLSYGNVARCVGHPLPPSATDEQAMIERLVPVKKSLDEFEQQLLAAACIAVGLPGRAITVLRHPKPPAFKPGETFGPNLPGFMDYLCAAITSGAAARDVEPAWQAMHADFPRKLAAKTMKWSTLLWLARAVHSRIGGRPEAEVCEAVHTLSTR
jgi:hypothetical protein